MRWLEALLVVLAAAGAVGVAADAKTTTGGAIDRTLACIVLPAGVGAIQAAAYPRLGSANATPAQATVSTGNGGGFSGESNMLVAVYAAGVPHWPSGLIINTKLCHPAKADVPLDPRGLSGGLEPLGAKANCLTARRVFVHLHVATATKPTSTSNASIEAVHFKPLSAEIAIRSRKQKPLVFMSLEGRHASFYSAKSCF